MGIEERVLTPGREVDVASSVMAYARNLPPGREGKSHDLVKAVTDRSMEVLHPFLLQAARGTRGKTVSLDGDWSYSFADTGNPWRQAVFVGNPRGFGYLCVLDLHVRPTDEALASFGEGRAGDGPGSRDTGGVGTGTLARIQARLAREKELVDAGFTGGMPDPDSVTRVRGAGIHVVRPDDAVVREDAILRPGTLRETLSAVAAGNYSEGRIVSFVPDGGRLKSHGECLLTTATLDALTVLGRVAADAAGSAAVSARNEAVASTGVTTLCDTSWETALLEAAAGAVYQDGGSPGDETRRAVSNAWLHDVDRSIPRLAREIEDARGIMEARGHTSRGSAYECNDGDDRMWVSDAPGGIRDTYVEGPAGLYMVRRDDSGGRTSLVAARLGECGQERGLMPPELALAYGAHGFLGRYRMGGEGTAYTLEPPRLSDEAVVAFDALAIGVSSLSACAEDEYGGAGPAP